MIQFAKAPNLVLTVRRLGARARGLVLPAALLCGLGWAYLQTLAPSITWANNGADSGDLVTAATTLGVAHASGYPTYLLLARFFLLLPVGELALRVNLLSLTAGLLTVQAIYMLVRRLSGPHDHNSALAAGLAALALGLAPLFWSQAIIAEVYTLNTAFCAALLWFSAAPAQSRAALFLQGLVVGLALGNHLTIALFGAAWLLWAGYSKQRTERETERRYNRQDANAPRYFTALVSWCLGGYSVKDISVALVGVGVGLLVYLYLPLRAAAHPPINWGGAQSWAGFWWLVSGALYRPLAFGLPQAQIGARLAASAGLLVQQFGVAGLALGCAGLIYGAPRARRYVWASAGLAGAQTIFALAYNTADSEVYLLPAIVIFAMWIGLGAAALLAALRAHAWWAAPLAAGLLAASLLWQAPATWRRVDASHDTRAVDYAAQVLAAAPARAIVLASSDHDSFALWYAHYAEGQRSDTAVLVEPLLDFDWYRANLRAVYPDLHMPAAPQSDWRAALAAANMARPAVCRTGLDDDPVLRCK